MAEERFSLASGGPFYRLTRGSFRDQRRVVRVTVELVALAWLPVIVLAVIEWIIRRRGLEMLRDPSVHVRLLVAIPLFILGERMLDRLSGRAVQRFRIDRLGNRPEALVKAIHRTEALRDSWIPEALMLLLALLTGQAVMRSWLHDMQGARSLAWTWYTIVALPVFAFLLYRSLWRWLLWCLFLWRLLRADIHPLPMHPDRSGGLAFLSSPAIAFLVVCVAINCAFCAGWLSQVLFAHAHVTDFRSPLIALIVVETALAYLPLCVFTRRLYRAKREWQFEHGHLAATMTRTFHEHWIVNPPARSALESEESSQMSDYGAVYRLLTEMRLVPFAWRAVLRFVIFLALPALPVALAEFPLAKILPKLVRLVGGAPV